MIERICFCVTRDGTRIAYATHGQGPPLVKVANWFSHLEYDRASPVYGHWIDALSREHTLVCYDARDTGLSDREVDRVGLDGWVQDLEAVVDDLGLERFPLLAMSQAGPIALEYAARHPDRVSRLVLYGTYACGRIGHDPSGWKQREIDALMTLVESAWSRDNPEIRQLWTTRFIPGGSLEQMRWFNDMQRGSASAAAAIRTFRVHYSLDLAERARRIRVPTLVLHSQGDALVPFESGRELAALVPGATFVPLDSRNHLLLAGEPAWPRFLLEVEEFLRTATARGIPERREILSDLTLRERELLDLVAAGLDNGEIAARLVISPKTVRNHITHVFDKLGVTNRGRAIVIARDAGLGRPPPDGKAPAVATVVPYRPRPVRGFDRLGRPRRVAN